VRAIAATIFLFTLCLCACGRKEAPADEGPDPSKKVGPDKSGRVDPAVQEDLDEITWLDEVAGEEEGSELKGSTSVDDAGKSERTLTLELTADQREDLERQRRANRGSGRGDVTVTFTPQQLEDIREVCPKCREKAITWHTDRVGVRVKLHFDDEGRILRPPDPFPYVSR
jgi:hypothetical protein